MSYPYDNGVAVRTTYTVWWEGLDNLYGAQFVRYRTVYPPRYVSAFEYYTTIVGGILALLLVLGGIGFVLNESRIQATEALVCNVHVAGTPDQPEYRVNTDKGEFKLAYAAVDGVDLEPKAAFERLKPGTIFTLSYTGVVLTPHILRASTAGVGTEAHACK